MRACIIFRFPRIAHFDHGTCEIVRGGAYIPYAETTQIARVSEYIP